MGPKKFYSLAIFIIFFASASLSHAQNNLLTPEEKLWLQSRNNTIIVFPQKNRPPFSYQNSTTLNQGLSIDFIELVADKIGAKIEYLPARFLTQIIDEAKAGKGDVITSLNSTKEREEFFYFTDNYVSIPAVIVVRKDFKKRVSNLNDFSGMKVAVRDDSAVEEFIQKNFPTVVIEPMTDDEIALQQLVLGEVDAIVMDVASLSYFLSKQVLTSVKIVGSTGFDYELSFAVTKDKKILQSILEKGLSQISKNDRQILIDKWINISNTEEKSSLFGDLDNFNDISTYVLSVIILTSFGLLLYKHRNSNLRYWGRSHIRDDLKKDLKEEIEELEYANKAVVRELEDIKDLEKDIEEKLKKLD